LAGLLANDVHAAPHTVCPVEQHTPPPHRPLAQTTPQAPQFAELLPSAVHTPLHAVCPPEHVCALTSTVFASSPPT
jgi:hypothetical protein